MRSSWSRVCYDAEIGNAANRQLGTTSDSSASLLPLLLCTRENDGLSWCDLC